MSTEDPFTIQKPKNLFLSTLVDNYFYIDSKVEELSLREEYVLPFPRITFGYFFDHPFLVSNESRNESASLDMVISRISKDKITVQPQSKIVRILGAHLQPFGLAYLTKVPISTLPWIINTFELFGVIAEDFKRKISKCTGPEQMFDVVEKTFLDSVLVRDLSLITNAVNIINDKAGQLKVSEVSEQLGISDLHVRTHFENHIGCSPKEYIRLVRLKQVAFQLTHSKDSMTEIGYQADYFDQSHFIHEVKGITGKSPKELKKDIPSFRFLQF